MAPALLGALCPIGEVDRLSILTPCGRTWPEGAEEGLVRMNASTSHRIGMRSRDSVIDLTS